MMQGLYANTSRGIGAYRWAGDRGLAGAGQGRIARMNKVKIRAITWIKGRLSSHCQLIMSQFIQTTTYLAGFRVCWQTWG